MSWMVRTSLSSSRDDLGAQARISTALRAQLSFMKSTSIVICLICVRELCRVAPQDPRRDAYYKVSLANASGTLTVSPLTGTIGQLVGASHDHRACLLMEAGEARSWRRPRPITAGSEKYPQMEPLVEVR